MILYRIAKWMEERRRIVTIIKETEGDVSFLLHKIEQADERMMAEAGKWAEKGEIGFAPLPDLVMFEQVDQESVVYH